MENLRRALPIRKYALRDPIVIAFNIHLSHYNAFGTNHYDRIKNALVQQDNADLDPEKVILLPNVTNMTSSIESRGASLAKNLARALDKMKVHRCHLVSHSFTGVDARAAISMYGAADRVKSLTTLSSPHHGLSLIDMALQSERFNNEAMLIEKAFEMLGLTRRSAEEFTSWNMKDFNTVCDDAPHVDYFSIGAYKDGKLMNPLLKHGHDMVVGKRFDVQTDGLVMDEEARWGKYLLTFNNDHFEMVGFEPEHDPANIYNLVADNARVCEISNDQEMAFEYGLD